MNLTTAGVTSTPAEENDMDHQTFKKEQMARFRQKIRKQQEEHLELRDRAADIVEEHLRRYRFFVGGSAANQLSMLEEALEELGEIQEIVLPEDLLTIADLFDEPRVRNAAIDALLFRIYVDGFGGDRFEAAKIAASLGKNRMAIELLLEAGKQLLRSVTRWSPYIENISKHYLQIIEELRLQQQVRTYSEVKAAIARQRLAAVPSAAVLTN